MAEIINLDAGHGYNTAGKRSPDGVREWTLNNAVVVEAMNLLSAYDCTVYRLDDPTGNTDVGINDRRAKAERNGGILVSVHHNAYQGTWGNHTGLETWYGITDFSKANVHPKSKDFASVIQKHLVAQVGLKDRGTKTSDNYGVIRTSQLPAILVEGGFYDSTIDFPVINSADGQKKYAQAVCNGLVEFCGLKLKDVPVVPQPAPTPTPEPAKKSNEEIAQEVIRGEWGNGDDRKNRLTNAGYDYSAVQAIVNGKVSTPTPTKQILLNTGSWNVRSGAGTNFSSVKIIKGGVIINSYGKSGTWYKIDGGYIGPAAVKKEV